MSEQSCVDEAFASAGNDSLMDVIANLVGILIILVMLVGSQAGRKIHDQAVEKSRESLDLVERDISDAARDAAALQRDIAQLEQQVRAENAVAAARAAERDALLVELTDWERRLEEERAVLTATERQWLERQTAVADLQRQLADVRASAQALQAAGPATRTIEHLPTPIAKTVLTKEMHFRLLGGRIVHVPLDELVDLMRGEWLVKARKLEHAPRTVEMVGPIGEFRLQYELEVRDEPVRTEAGFLVRQIVRFTRFELIPTSDSIGQPLDEALAAGSDFRSRIDRAAPERITVSLWVYPDSFDEYNRLKRWLYERGIQTACWPINQGSRIAGSPDGLRSTAQ
jgi:hypothetical protein